MTYALNTGLEPIDRDISSLSAHELAELVGLGPRDLDVLIACAPCTGLSRANPNNHIYDDPRNSLIVHTAHFVDYFRPRILVMENAREMLQGNFSHHFTQLRSRLERLGYSVSAKVHMLSQFGLPQKRERAIIVAVAKGLPLLDLDSLWNGWSVAPESITVRRAIGHLPPVEAGSDNPDDASHIAPAMQALNRERIAAIPHDGGSWIDLARRASTRALLTAAMERNFAQGRIGSYPDIYGRMFWDKPAPTIKRECGHLGNGRYAHPEQDRLCTVREMALLSGFPHDFLFGGSLSNRYRHVGDAVPPLISFQLAHLCNWILGGVRPGATDIVLPGSSLTSEDVFPEARATQLSLT